MMGPLCTKYQTLQKWFVTVQSYFMAVDFSLMKAFIFLQSCI